MATEKEPEDVELATYQQLKRIADSLARLVQIIEEERAKEVGQ